ncbi:MAG: transport system ATP-binding/permease protein, partial [Streptomyces sp.]|nr:transport system ATP-binding/permease protein [Streptomyces sp.]
MVERHFAPDAPELVLETDDGQQVIVPGRTYHVGRDPLSEVAYEDPRVSWHHALLRADDNGWILEDSGSTNGTYADGKSVRQWGVGPGSMIRFGHPADGPWAKLSGVAHGPETQAFKPEAYEPPLTGPVATGTFRQPTSIRSLPARTVRIGRAADSDVVVDDLVVSRHHAELRAAPGGGYEIIDLGSHNGTYLNGQPVARAAIHAGDIVGIGHSVFRLVGDKLVEFTDTGEVSLQVRDLAVEVDGGRKTLLDHVSFP